MRLMLGTKDSPSLLVEVADKFDETDFKFYVINGAWEGTFKNGDIRVNGRDYSDDAVTARCVEILSDNQDRLRGEYQDVFDNFNNQNYIAPSDEFEAPEDWDDDIPF